MFVKGKTLVTHKPELRFILVCIQLSNVLQSCQFMRRGETRLCSKQCDELLTTHYQANGLWCCGVKCNCLIRSHAAQCLWTQDVWIAEDWVHGAYQLGKTKLRSAYIKQLCFVEDIEVTSEIILKHWHNYTYKYYVYFWQLVIYYCTCMYSVKTRTVTHLIQWRRLMLV